PHRGTAEGVRGRKRRCPARADPGAGFGPARCRRGEPGVRDDLPGARALLPRGLSGGAARGAQARPCADGSGAGASQLSRLHVLLPSQRVGPRDPGAVRGDHAARAGKTPAPAEPAETPPEARSAKRGRSLVIVESPAKARTIGKYLGSGFEVRASNGHVRDLPKSKLGVDIEHGFQPSYILIK